MNKYLRYHTVLNGNEIYFIDNKIAGWNKIAIDELELEQVKSIAPNYMMEPSVTIQNK